MSSVATNGTSNNSTGFKIPALPFSTFGLTFVVTLDSIIFFIALFIFFVFYRRTALYKNQRNKRSISESDAELDSIQLEELSPPSNPLTRFGSRIYKWLFSVSEYEKFGATYGQEAGVYMWFSKQMLLALSICTFLALTILLPIHLTGSPTLPSNLNYGSRNYTEAADYFLVRATVVSVQDSYHKLWAHVTLTVLFSAVFLFFLNRFHSATFVQRGSGSFRYNKDETIYGRVSNFTAEVSGLPKDLIDNEKLREAFEQLYPSQIYSARIVLDTSQKIVLHRKLNDIENKIRHVEAVIEKTGKRPRTCSCFKGVGCCSSRVDQLSHLEDRKQTVREQIQDLNEVPLTSTGSAFVIFKNISSVVSCVKSGNNGRKYLNSNGLKFRVFRAREPDDIIWENYNIRSRSRNLRVFFVHAILAVLLIFFTSPLSILNLFSAWMSNGWLYTRFQKFRENVVGDLLIQYIPTLLLVILSNVLPLILYYLSGIERYKSKSQIHRINLMRLYVYLCLTTLILPSLLQLSINSIIESTLKNSFEEVLYRIFLPAAGAFFLIYSIQYVLLGNTADVLHAITEEEKEEATNVAEFDSGFEYSFLISFFAIAISYSVFSPLILFVGLVYSISKYCIDRHNITILYDKNSKASHKVIKDLWAYREKTKLVTVLVMVSLLIFQTFMVIYFARSGPYTYMHTSVLSLLLIITFIYSIIWTVRYRSGLDVVEKKYDDSKSPTFPLISQKSDDADSINVQYLDKFKESYLSPYSMETDPRIRSQIEYEAAELMTRRDDTELSSMEDATVIEM
ncbi:9 TM domain-containing transmembrane protein [Acrasis kona]|uniref:9 TM domain-containing transmembrane protein n=1 Tax=Acrasis kona TaxID=1008807 RepID=A0AAW2ZGN1_9EUKA